MERTARWVNDATAERPSGRLQDKVAVVTGSSTGIGRAIALLFAREGAHVVCADIRETASDEAADEAHRDTTAELINGLYVRTNVGHSEDVQNLVSRTVQQYGRLDIFVNNAGISPEEDDPRPIWAADESVFDITQQTNTRGVFLGCKYASAQMRGQQPHRNGDRGWIINIGSVLGGVVGTENAPSLCASKGAVSSLTKAAAMDCAPYRIHVNAICPGYTLTASLDRSLMRNEERREDIIDMHPFRGLGIPDDIARATLFLSSEESGWITGISLPVDGGYSSR